jgi:hypothetical protein
MTGRQRCSVLVWALPELLVSPEREKFHLPVSPLEVWTVPKPLVE